MRGSGGQDQRRECLLGAGPRRAMPPPGSATRVRIVVWSREALAVTCPRRTASSSARPLEAFSE
eukprot:2658318-Rhodomonas_salina.2